MEFAFALLALVLAPIVGKRLALMDRRVKAAYDEGRFSQDDIFDLQQAFRRIESEFDAA